MLRILGAMIVVGLLLGTGSANPAVNKATGNPGVGQQGCRGYWYARNPGFMFKSLRFDTPYLTAGNTLPEVLVEIGYATPAELIQRQCPEAYPYLPYPPY